MRKTLLLTSLLAAFTIGAACSDDDPAGPDFASGTFALAKLNDAQLPYDHEGLGCCTYLSGALELDAGDYEVSITARNRNTQAVFTAIEWGKYTSQGASVTFARDSFAVQPLLLDVATMHADSIKVSFGGEGPGSSDQFRAVFRHQH